MPERLTPEAREQIRQRAEAARNEAPGPWFMCEVKEPDCIYDDTHEGIIFVHGNKHRVSRYIAAVDPTSILSLLAELDALQRERDEAPLLVPVSNMDLLVRQCEQCKEHHIFGFYHQLTPEQKHIDREKMIVTVSGTCKCGAAVSSEYGLFTSPDGSAAKEIDKLKRRHTDTQVALIEVNGELQKAKAELDAEKHERAIAEAARDANGAQAQKFLEIVERLGVKLDAMQEALTAMFSPGMETPYLVRRGWVRSQMGDRKWFHSQHGNVLRSHIEAIGIEIQPLVHRRHD